MAVLDSRKLFEIAVSELQHRKFTFLTESEMHDIYDDLCRYFKRQIFYQRTEKPESNTYRLDATATVSR